MKKFLKLIKQAEGLLDKFSGASVGYSLDKINSKYKGSAIRVRRSSDGSETDIGFVGDTLDIASLESFASGTDAFVTTWYDQSGNTNNATQTTNANQPQIVSNGSVVLENGKPSVFFNNTNQNSLSIGLVSDLGIDGSNAKSLFSVVSTNVNGFVVAGTSSITSFTALRYRSSNSSGNGRVEIQGFGFEGNDISDNIQKLFSSVFNGTQTQDFDLSVNGVLVNGTGTNIVNTEGSEILKIGYLSGTIAENDGYLSELIIYDSDQSSNREGIETNINNRYSIY
ncbi:MAG: hypothetical protein HRT87_11990 [Legionellales bacterium]|nr:hypothetical protein [Legionellales bacterium]